MSKKELLRRYIWFFIGLFILSFGIALSTKAHLGTSPVSSIPYVLSMYFPLTMGNLTIIIQSIYIVAEIIILRRDFKPIQFLQIIIVVIFGYFVDLNLFFMQGLEPNSYPMQWAFCIISMFFIAFGVNMEVKAGVMMLAVDGLMATISKVWKIDFGKVKIAFDSSQVAVAVICSFLLMHGLKGVREGTIAAAIFVGIIIKQYNKHLGGFYARLGLTPIGAQKVAKETEEAIAAAGVHVITIAREVGAGGFEIGTILAKRLGWPIYDKDMIYLAAEEQGLDPIQTEKVEQRRIYNYFMKLNDEIYAPMLGDFVEDTKIKDVQQEMVRRIAAEQSCIIVGRLANYYLKDRTNCFNVFIHGDVNYRIAHFQKENGMTFEAAKEELERRDLERRRHYRFYTGSDYGYYKDYHLVVNSSVYGSEKAADLIQEAANTFFQKQEE